VCSIYSTKVLLCRDYALSTKVLEVLVGVRRMLEAVENCTVYAVGTAGDALGADVVEVVLGGGGNTKVPEVTLRRQRLCWGARSCAEVVEVALGRRRLY